MKKINLTEYIRKSAVQVSLSDSERERMKRVLSEYMSMKPMRSAPLERRSPLTYMALSLYAFSRKSVAVLLLFAILFSGAGVSFAAENALPGDALYSLKVGVNEPLVAALSVSPESKALWNAERAERRLEEAAKLASVDRLTDEKKIELEERFEAHAEKVVVDIERLETSDASGAADIAARFEYKLLAHEVVLEDVLHAEKVQELRDRVKTKAARLAAVGERVRGVPDAGVTVALASAPAPEAATTMMMSVAADTAVSEEPVLMKARTAEVVAPAPAVAPAQPAVKEETVKRFASSAEEEFKDATKMYERVKAKLSDEASLRVRTQLTHIENLLSSAKDALIRTELSVAFAAYREAAGSSAKLTVFLKAFQKSRLTEIPIERNEVLDNESEDDDRQDLERSPGAQKEEPVFQVGSVRLN